jgi:ketosteroid isomerase-like protein
MSQENLDLVRTRLNIVVEAFNARGVDAALPHIHPELVWNAPPEWLESDVYRGREGLRELATSWGQNFDEYRLDLERVVDLGDGRAVALVHQRGRLKGTGHPMEMAVGWIVELVDGQVARVDVYFSWEAALDAAGLSE